MITREQLQQIRDALDQAVNGSLLRDGLNHDDDELSSIAARSDNAYTKVKLVCHVKRLGEALRILDAALSAPDQEPVDDDWTQEDGKHLHEPVTAPVAAPDPQPVAWRDKSALPGYPSYEYNRQGIGEPLYTKPVAAQYSDLVSDGGLDPRNASDVAAPQDQDAKDAARYRWLRDKSEPAYFIRMPYNLWDETIDAAIQ